MKSTCGPTITGKRRRYETLLHILQGTASCCLRLIRFILCDKFGSISTTPGGVRDQIDKLKRDPEAYNGFYNNLVRQFEDNNLPQVIELCVQTNLLYCSLEKDVEESDDGSCVEEPIYRLWMFLLRIMDERPALVLKEDNAEGTYCSFLQESLEHFISEQTRLKRPTWELPVTSLTSLTPREEKRFPQLPALPPLEATLPPLPPLQPSFSLQDPTFAMPYPPPFPLMPAPGVPVVPPALPPLERQEYRVKRERVEG